MTGVTDPVTRRRLARVPAILVGSALVLALLAGVVFVGAAQSAPDCEAVSYDGTGTSADPFRISTIEQLQCIGEAPGASLDAHYRLQTDVDASDTGAWNGGAGFEPIGDLGDRFMGTFDGDGHRITNLEIDRSDERYVGLFGVVGPSGTVTDVGLDGATVSGGDWTGALVGTNEGTVARAYANGTVDGSLRVGGLVGESRATVEAVYATVEIDGDDDVGGLVGENRGRLRESYAVGNATGSGDHVGGLVGRNTAAVTDSYWDGTDSPTSEGVGRGNSSGVTERSTPEMQRFAPIVYVDGLDFAETFVLADGYPALAWEGEEELTVDGVSATNASQTAGMEATITVAASASDGGAAADVAIEVVDAGDLDGLSGGDTATTADDGEATFTFNDTDEGTYDLEFAWANDTSVTDTATVTVVPYALDSLTASETSAAAGDAGDLVVTLDDGANGPVDGETVEIVDDGGLASLSAGDSNETNADGETRFSFEEETAGEFTVTVAVADWDTVTDTSTVTIGPSDQRSIDAADATGVAGQQGAVTVSVVDEFGNAVPGETIEVTDDGGISGVGPGETSVTNSAGSASFEFAETRAAEYELTFALAADDTKTDTATVTVDPAEASITSSSLSANPADATTTVSDEFGDGNERTYDLVFADEFGNPLSNVDVDVGGGQDVAVDGGATRSTDAAGAVRFTVQSTTAQDGSLTFTERESNLALVDLVTFEAADPVAVDASSQDRIAGAASDLVVTIDDEFDNPVPGYDVNLTDAADLSGVNESDLATSDEHGRARFSFNETRPGEYSPSVELVADDTITDTATVTVERAEAAGSASSVTPSSSTTSVASDFEAYTLEYEATFADEFGNPYDGVAVELAGGTDIFTQGGETTKTTDAEGTVTFVLRSETLQENVVFTFTESESGHTETATGTFEPGPGASLDVLDASVTRYAGVSGDVEAVVRDEFDHRVPGEPVDLGDTDLTIDESVVTDGDGVATFGFTERLPGTYPLEMELADDASVTDTATVDVAVSFEGGDGSTADPYRIATWDQLQAMGSYHDQHFVLVDDLDAATANHSAFVADPAEGFWPIGGSNTPFSGTFDGNDRTIADLRIDRTASTGDRNASLFGVLSGGDIGNLTLANSTVTADSGGGAAAIVLDGDASTITGVTLSNATVRAGFEGDAAGIVGTSSATDLSGIAVLDSHVIAGEGDDGADGADGTSVTGREELAEDGEDGEAGGRAGGLGIHLDGGSVTDSFVSRSRVAGGDGGTGGAGGEGASHQPWHIDGDGGTGGTGGAAGGVFVQSIGGEVSRVYVHGGTVEGGSGGSGGSRGSGTDSNGADGPDGTDGPASGVVHSTDDDVSETYAATALVGGETAGISVTNDGTISDSYWNAETTDTDIGIHGGSGTHERVTALTTDEMRGVAETTMATFDFDSTWDVVFVPEDGRTVSYPFLLNNTQEPAPGLETLYADGSGSEPEPYLIEDWRHLDNLRVVPDVEFALNASLDPSSANYEAFVDEPSGGFEPIGDSFTRFDGTFDGANHTIADLEIDREGENYVGLFGVVGPDGSITNVGLTNATVTGDRWVGPLVGDNQGDVTRSYANGTVTGDASVGGLLGENLGTVTETYATASVDGGTDVGGLAGQNRGEIRDSFAAGSVADGDDTVAGFLGGNTATVVDSYWDRDASTQAEGIGTGDGSGATGLSTVEMQRFAPSTTMDALDYGDAWTLTDAYPRLADEGVERITVDALEVESTDGNAGEPGTIRVTAGEPGSVTVTALVSGDDAGEGVTLEVVDDDGLDGLDVGETRTTDASGEVSYAFTETRAADYEPVVAVEGEGGTAVTIPVSVDPAEAVDATSSIEPTAGTTTVSDAFGDGNELTFDLAFADEFGNPLAGVPVTFDGDESLAVDGHLVRETTPEGTVQFVVQSTQAQSDASFTVTESESNLVLTATGTFEPGAPSTLSVDDVTQDAGTPGELTISLEDDFGNAITDGPVRVADNGSLGGIETGAELRTPEKGDLRVPFSEQTAGDYTVEFEVVGHEAVSDTATVTIDSGAVDSFSLVSDPTDTVAGDPVNGSPTVRVTDEFGNPLADVPVTVEVPDGSFAAGATTVETNDTGHAAFTDLVLESVGAYELTFAVDPLTAVVATDAFSVTAAEAHAISVETHPDDVEEGDVLAGPPTASLVDEFGNPVVGHPVTVRANETGVLSGNTTASTNGTGFAVFDDLVADPGTYTLTFDVDGLAKPPTSDPFTVAAAPPTPSPSPSPSPSPDPDTTVRTGDAGEGTTTDTRVTVENPTPTLPIIIEGQPVDGDGDQNGTGAVPEPLSGVESVQLDRLILTVDSAADFTLDVTTYDTDLTPSYTHTADAPDQEVQRAAERFERDLGTVAAGYIHVDHALAAGQVRTATFEFSISESTLDSLGVDPGDVTLYRQDEDGVWNERDTEHVNSSGAVHQFTADTPGFSVFALDTGAPTAQDADDDSVADDGDSTSEDADDDSAADDADEGSAAAVDRLSPVSLPLAAIIALLAIASLVYSRRT